MLIDLLATLAAGLVGGGTVLLLRRLSGGRLPRFLIPTTAGVAMIAFPIWSEYSWFSRTTAALPEGVTVFSSHAAAAPWRPWTYAAPVTERFAAVDRGSLRRNDRVPGQVIADIYLFARHAPVTRISVLIDCTGHRRTDLADGAEFGPDGAIIGAAWTSFAADDPLAGSVCPET